MTIRLAGFFALVLWASAAQAADERQIEQAWEYCQSYFKGPWCDGRVIHKICIPFYTIDACNKLEAILQRDPEYRIRMQKHREQVEDEKKKQAQEFIEKVMK